MFSVHWKLFLRLSNMMQLTKMKSYEILDIVKGLKSNFSLNKICSQGFYEEDMELNIRTLEQALQLKSSEVIWKNMTHADLDTAANIFLYLNSCSDLVKKWIIFYSEVFLHMSPSQIVLTLNRILKGDSNTPQSLEFRNIAHKLFEEAATSLKLKYKEIKNLTQGHGSSFFDKASNHFDEGQYF